MLYYCWVCLTPLNYCAYVNDLMGKISFMSGPNSLSGTSKILGPPWLDMVQNDVHVQDYPERHTASLFDWHVCINYICISYIKIAKGVPRKYMTQNETLCMLKPLGDSHFVFGTLTRLKEVVAGYGSSPFLNQSRRPSSTSMFCPNNCMIGLTTLKRDNCAQGRIWVWKSSISDLRKKIFNAWSVVGRRWGVMAWLLVEICWVMLPQMTGPRKMIPESLSKVVILLGLA